MNRYFYLIFLFFVCVLASVSVALPALAGDFPVPIEKKVIHYAPPSEYVGLKNPFKALLDFRSPAAPQHAIYDTLQGQQYARIIERGGSLYRANCAPCHGDRSNGRGPQSSGFYPPPADFTDTETITVLKENYIFWRIKDGGAEEPFKSAMPAFGDTFTDEEIWSIITYEYYNAGIKPKE